MSAASEFMLGYYEWASVLQTEFRNIQRTVQAQELELLDVKTQLSGLQERMIKEEESRQHEIKTLTNMILERASDGHLVDHDAVISLEERLARLKQEV